MVGALVKGITGLGYPIILVPVAALFVDASEAVVLVTISNLGMNLQLIWKGRSERTETRTVKRFLLSSVVGAMIGGYLLTFISDQVLRAVLIGVVAIFIGSRLWAPDVRIPPGLADRWSIPVGGIAGLFQGATSVSGPIVTPWFMSLGLARNTFVFSLSLVFGASGLAQILALALGGQFTADLFVVSVGLTPIALVVAEVGIALRSRLPKERFEQSVLVVLGLSAIGLTAKLIM